MQAYIENPAYFDQEFNDGKAVHANSSLPPTPTASQEDKDIDEIEQREE